MNYLSPSDSLAFIDHIKKIPTSSLTKECDVCKGYGGWNLKPYCYSMPHLLKNTSENRYKFVHFRCCCQNCFGWGYTKESHSCTGHNFIRVKKISNCLYLNKCIQCGEEVEIDSGD